MIHEILDVADAVVSIADGITQFINLIDWLQSIFSDKKHTSIYRIASSTANTEGLTFRCMMICTNKKYCKIRVIKRKWDNVTFNRIIKLKRESGDYVYKNLVSVLSDKYNVSFKVNDLSEERYTEVAKYLKNNVQ